MLKKLAALLLAATAAPAIAAPSDDLAKLVAEHWAWWLSVNPEQATALGERRYDDRLSDLSLEAAASAGARAAFFLPVRLPHEVAPLFKAC